MNESLDLEYDRLLGEGAYGKVFLVNQQDGEQVLSCSSVLGLKKVIFDGCVPLPEWTGMDMITGMDIKFTGMDLYFLSQAT